MKTAARSRSRPWCCPRSTPKTSTSIPWRGDEPRDHRCRHAEGAARLRLPRADQPPTGRFVTGGPKGDTGLTGRKIIVDTYGGAAPRGDGAFSGKDPSKVDRSAAYMARFLAKQVVGRHWASRCLVQLAYTIGVAEPVSFLVNAEVAGAARNAQIARAVQGEFDLTPAGIIRRLDRLRPIYSPTAAYGPLGRNDLALSWERTVVDGALS